MGMVLRAPYPTASGSRAWLPSDAAGTAWWDFSDSSSMTLAGGKIASTANKGTGPAQTQATTTAQPTLQTNAINGLSAAGFTGAAELMSLAFSVPGIYTTCAVFSVSTLASPSAIFDSDDRGANRIAQFLRVNASRAQSITFSSTTNGQAQSSANLVVNTVYIVTVCRTATTVDLYLNGTLQQSTPVAGTPASGTVVTSIGQNLGNDAAMQGLVGSISLTPNDVTTDTRQRLEGWAANHFLLTAGLPAGHPYKSAAPTYP